MRLLFLHRSTCSGEMTLPVNGPISVPALIQVLEKMPSPSPGMELWAMITSDGSTRLDNFCTSVGGEEGSEKGPGTFHPAPAPPLPGWPRGRAGVPGEGGSGDPSPTPAQIPGLRLLNAQPGSYKAVQGSPRGIEEVPGKSSPGWARERG